MNEKPRLLYGASVRRRRFFSRFLRAVLIVAAAAGAFWALDEAVRRGLADPAYLLAGQLVAVALGGLAAVRGLYNLWLWLSRRDESIRFYDKGIIWSSGNNQHKYAWHQLMTYREGARGIYLMKWPLVQWDGNRFTMADGSSFVYTGRFGDTRAATEAVRRYAAYVTGVHMGRSLRAEQPVRLHRRLTVYPGGIESGKEEIHWSQADVRLDGGRLVIRRIDERGRARTIRRYRARDVDNVGGFLELTSATIRNHQPERFNRQAL
jgi:hypothetical protein